MQLKTVFVRFYKSFNFDYLRKYHAEAEPEPWELIDEMWYPYVRIPIDSKVTTIVGANESGKSHLLTAIEKGILGGGIKREDFCRYSQFFTVEQGQMKWPDFGFEWEDLTAQDQQQVRSACNIAESTIFDRYFLFRNNRETLTVYLPTGNGYSRHELKGAGGSDLQRSLPHIFRINADIALPDSVSIKGLAGETTDSSVNLFERLDRQDRFKLLETFEPVASHHEWFASTQAATEHAAQISSTISSLLPSYRKSSSDNAPEKRKAEFSLVRDLLYKVANVDPEALSDLYRALREGKEGHANGLIQKINDHLATSLNFPHWWVQDRNFQLVVSPREFDLVFTIRDRTETEYSFMERSSGLKYFLSYYVQYRAHVPRDKGPEILLMDEPDAYLSSQAQQDLLKIFDAFANPEDGRRPIQVIYVTHSPFLIDKNHAERIRVLEKGVAEEGTRVVKDAAKNHYEPLRSAFGAFVGETTFIGNSNLMVEGQADQILIAGAATHLRSQGASKLETLDLNRVTIVPAGSASNIPYMVYLARGRDIEQPAVIVLLDSDPAGNNAKKKLQKGGAHGRQLLKPSLVLQIGDLANEKGLVLTQGRLVEIEDLIPISICLEASRSYAREVCGADERIVAAITEDAIRAQLTDDKTVFDAVKACFASLSEEELHIEKVGFARSAIDAVTGISRQEWLKQTSKSNDIKAFEENMKILFRRIDKIRREAERELVGDRVSQKVERLKKSFLQDNPVGARRERAHVLFDDMEASLDDGTESDAIKLAISKLRREFDIDKDITQPIANYTKFRDGLEQIQYAGRIATQDYSSDDSKPISESIEHLSQTQGKTVVVGGNEVSVAPKGSKN